MLQGKGRQIASALESIHHFQRNSPTPKIQQAKVPSPLPTLIMSEVDYPQQLPLLQQLSDVHCIINHQHNSLPAINHQHNSLPADNHQHSSLSTSNHQNRSLPTINNQHSSLPTINLNHTTLPTTSNLNNLSQQSQPQSNNRALILKSAVSRTHLIDMCPSSIPSINCISEGIKAQLLPESAIEDKSANGGTTRGEQPDATESVAEGDKSDAANGATTKEDKSDEDTGDSAKEDKDDSKENQADAAIECAAKEDKPDAPKGASFTEDQTDDATGDSAKEAKCLTTKLGKSDAANVVTYNGDPHKVRVPDEATGNTPNEDQSETATGNYTKKHPSNATGNNLVQENTTPITNQAVSKRLDHSQSELLQKENLKIMKKSTVIRICLKLENTARKRAEKIKKLRKRGPNLCAQKETNKNLIGLFKNYNTLRKNIKML